MPLSAWPHRTATAGRSWSQEAFHAPPPFPGPRAGPGCHWLHDPHPWQGLSSLQRPLFHRTSVAAASKPTCELRLWAASAGICSALPLLLWPLLAPVPCSRSHLEMPCPPSAHHEDARALVQVLPPDNPVCRCRVDHGVRSSLHPNPQATLCPWPQSVTNIQG